MGDFDRCNAKTRQWEGGDVNNPKDPGGLTSRGVTQASGAEYRRRHGLAPKLVTAWSDAEVTSFYREEFWAPVAGDALPAGVDLSGYDFGVNSGPSRSIKKLQGLVGVTVDGKMGPKTIAAIKAADPVALIKAHCASRISFLQALAVWNTFGKGWSRRVADILATALVWAGADAAEIKAEASKTDAKKTAASTAATATAGASGGTVATQTVDPSAVEQAWHLPVWSIYALGAVGAAIIFCCIVWALIYQHRAEALRAAAESIA